MESKRVPLFNRLRSWSLVGLCGLCACRPELNAGEWVCAEPDSSQPKPSITDPVQMPWSTSFEDRFCDYTPPAGFCYTYGNSSYQLVTAPVHTGRYAAAFDVVTGDGPEEHARCVRQGGLPTSAYYGAWYYVPDTADTDGKTWNLLHFQGGSDPSERLHNLWDVSLVNGVGGELELEVHSPLIRMRFSAEPPKRVPIGKWFHIEFFLQRAADATGAIALYQDGALLFEAADLITDDSSFGQWYVGNYSDGLTPPASTLYVDDVSIRAKR